MPRTDSMIDCAIELHTSTRSFFLPLTYRFGTTKTLKPSCSSQTSHCHRERQFSDERNHQAEQIDIELKRELFLVLLYVVRRCFVERGNMPWAPGPELS